MRKAIKVVLLACGLLLGCAKSEVASTDTAVTETVAPENVSPAPEGGSAGTSDSLEPATSTETTPETGQDSGENPSS